MNWQLLNRRSVMVGGLASLSGAISLPAWARVDIERQVTALEKAASNLGLNVAAPPSDLDQSRYSGLVVRLLPLANFQDNRAQVQQIVADAQTLLSDVNELERTPADFFLGISRGPAPKLKDLQDGYRGSYQEMKVDPNRRPLVKWYVDQVVTGKSRYAKVEASIGVPWFFIGITHGLEASFNFGGHLHNGDPLTDRTTHVPTNRPKKWNPPNDWESSAIDALTLRHLNNQSDWSLPAVLYRFEGYNGWGYHNMGKPSPYLWSFSNLYSKGKYRSDGRYDSSLTSKQCGAAVMLRSLVDEGHVSTSAL